MCNLVGDILPSWQGRDGIQMCIECAAQKCKMERWEGTIFLSLILPFGRIIGLDFTHNLLNGMRCKSVCSVRDSSQTHLLVRMSCFGLFHEFRWPEYGISCRNMESQHLEMLVVGRIVAECKLTPKLGQ